jgi:DDE superfamily endonuclease
MKAKLSLSETECALAHKFVRQGKVNTHMPASHQNFPPAEARSILQRLEFHYTPKHGSWLNMAEIEIAILQRNALSRRVARRGGTAPADFGGGNGAQ